MNHIKLYVIRDAKYPQWYFQRIEDYSSMMGYLAKNHPLFRCSSYSRSNCRKFSKSRKGGEVNWLKTNLKS